jgi:hypothetical protein
VSDEIRILRGTPTDEEVAAIVGVLLAARTTVVSEPPARSRWAVSARPAFSARAGGWRASGLPHR